MLKIFERVKIGNKATNCCRMLYYKIKDILFTTLEQFFIYGSKDTSSNSKHSPRANLIARDNDEKKQ